MKKHLLAAAALLAFSGAAHAADLPRRELPPAPLAAAPLPAFTWTGFYVGANAGGVLGGDFRGAGIDAGIPVGASLSAGGYAVNGTVGYNYQFGVGSGVVVGIEGDVGYSDVHNRVGVTIPGFGAGALEAKTDGLNATARGRLGYAFDRVMVYGTGGYAYTDASLGLALSDLAGNTAGAFSRTTGLDGWTVGGGVEAAFLGNWSAKAEYLYTQYDAKNFNFGGVAPTRVRADLDTHQLRVGINYRFNSFNGLGF